MGLTIACLGEVMVELSAPQDAPAQIGVAGDTFNWAVYLRRTLGPEHSVRYVTCLGHDPFSARIRAAIEAEEVDASHILSHDTRLPGLYAITLDDAGERSFHYWRGQSAARTLFETAATESAFAGADVIALSGITLAILSEASRARMFDFLARFRAGGGRVAFDSNYRPALWSGPEAALAAMEQMWAQTDIALPSVDDEMALRPGADASAIAAQFRAAGFAAGALKRGAEGPLGLATGAAPALPPVAKVVDTTSAGDSFNGAFLGTLLAGSSEEDALRAGHTCASRVIQHHGAIVPRSAW